jgi:hypothetical protein
MVILSPFSFIFTIIETISKGTTKHYHKMNTFILRYFLRYKL